MAKKQKPSFSYRMLLLPIKLLWQILKWIIDFFRFGFEAVSYLFIYVYYRFIKSFSVLNCLSGEEYEEICCHLLRKKGFHKIRRTAATGDHGIDILAKRQKKLYAIQCKFYQTPVGNAAVQQAYTGCDFYEADVAAVLTNVTFTRSAYAEAEKLGVLLWEENKIDV